MDGSHSGHVAAGLTSARQILWAEYSFRSTDTQAVYRQRTANALTSAKQMLTMSIKTGLQHFGVV